MRNVRKRTRRENCTSREKEDSQAISSTLVIPGKNLNLLSFTKSKCLLFWQISLILLLKLYLFVEPSISPDRAVQLAEWLKNNMWPANQVADYMKETAIHRAQWIRANGTKSIEEITCEFPRLLDTPGMVGPNLCIFFQKVRIPFDGHQDGRCGKKINMCLVGIYF